MARTIRSWIPRRCPGRAFTTCGRSLRRHGRGTHPVAAGRKSAATQFGGSRQGQGGGPVPRAPYHQNPPPPFFFPPREPQNFFLGGGRFSNPPCSGGFPPPGACVGDWKVAQTG